MTGPQRDQFRAVVASTQLDWMTRPYEVVDFLVNGRDLRDLVAVVERSAGAGDLAGSYLGLSWFGLDWLRYLLYAPPDDDEDGRTLLLGCICSTYDCWPLYARIDVEPDFVRWHDFRHGFRDWSYDALGPFTFARPAYDEALRAIGTR